MLDLFTLTWDWSNRILPKDVSYLANGTSISSSNQLRKRPSFRTSESCDITPNSVLIAAVLIRRDKSHCSNELKMSLVQMPPERKRERERERERKKVATCLFVFLRMLNDLLTLPVSPLSDSDKGIYMKRSKAYLNTNGCELRCV